MKLAIIIAIGGAAGALGRHLVTVYLGQLIGGGFPWAILTVNVLGSFLLGVITELAAQSVLVTPEVKALVTVGFLGAFTTFSTFSIETLNLIESGEIVKAGLNVFLSVVLCISACWIGLIVTRQL